MTRVMMRCVVPVVLAFATSVQAAGRRLELERVTADNRAILKFGKWEAAGTVHKEIVPAKPVKLPTVGIDDVGDVGLSFDIGPAAPVEKVPTYERGSLQCDGPRSSCVVRFKGPVIKCYGSRWKDHGMADVYLDGELRDTIDTYWPEPESDKVLFEFNELDETEPHELRIVLKREKAAPSEGRMQRIAGFDVLELVDYPGQLREVASAEMKQIVAGEKEYLKPSDWKPVPYKAHAPVSGVSLHEGALRSCFDRNILYLNRWFEGKDRWNDTRRGGWEVHLPASSEGRMLGGAGHTLRWEEREDMRAIVDKIVSVVKSWQRDDGYCLPYDDSTMAGGGGAWNDERRNYGRCNLTRGMIAAGMVGNRDALDVMRKFYDWLNPSDYCPKLLSGGNACGSAHNCNNGHEGHLLMYFSPVGKPDDLVAVERYFVQKFFIEESRKGEPLSLCYYPYHTPHCYVLLAYNAWLDHYRATGAPKYIEAAKGAWDIVHDYFLHLGGSLAICEAGGGRYPPGSQLLDPSSHTGETCGSVFWVGMNHKLLQFYPDEARYADEIESTIINVIMGVQDENGNIRYHSHLIEQKAGATSMNTCCEVFGCPFIARMPEYIYSISEDGLYVNLYVPSSITWEQDGKGFELVSKTRFPYDGKVALSFTKAPGVVSKLRVRVPGWVTGDVDITVNGASAAKGSPGSYVTLDRVWQPGDTVEFELPMQARMVLYTGLTQDPEHDRYALMIGPVLMALLGATDLDMPADELPSRLRPIEGEPLRYRVEGVKDVRYQPYWQLQTEMFTCFPTMR